MSPNASTILLLLTHGAVYTPHRLSGRKFCHFLGDSFFMASLMSTFRLVMKWEPKEPACRAWLMSIQLSGDEVTPALTLTDYSGEYSQCSPPALKAKILPSHGITLGIFR